MKWITLGVLVSVVTVVVLMIRAEAKLQRKIMDYIAYHSRGF